MGHGYSGSRSIRFLLRRQRRWKKKKTRSISDSKARLRNFVNSWPIESNEYSTQWLGCLILTLHGSSQHTLVDLYPRPCSSLSSFWCLRPCGTVLKPRLFTRPFRQRSLSSLYSWCSLSVRSTAQQEWSFAICSVIVLNNLEWLELTDYSHSFIIVRISDLT